MVNSMMFKRLHRYRSAILYGISLAALLLLLRWLELRFIIVSHSFEIYAGIIALLFTCLGIWLALKLSRPKTNTVIIEKEVFIHPPAASGINEKAITDTGLSNREMEVLQLMADGLSNHEIAARLFVSLSTIKTHSSRILEKLDVRRRTQAINKAKKLNIIV